jgi:hypothetical protein
MDISKIEYTILSGSLHGTDDLAEKVNRYIANGWMPCGGLAATATSSIGDRQYLQAMMRATPISLDSEGDKS